MLFASLSVCWWWWRRWWGVLISELADFMLLAAHSCVPSACGPAMCVTYTPARHMPLMSLTSLASTPDSAWSLSSYHTLFPFLQIKKKKPKERNASRGGKSNHALRPYLICNPFLTSLCQLIKERILYPCSSSSFIS